MRTVVEPQRELPVIKEADVVVAGGGPGGWPAAVAAARQGAKVVLLEKNAFLGGMGTAANVNQWSLRVMAKGIREKEAVVAGISREVIDRMLEWEGLFEPNDVWEKTLYTEIRWRTMFPYDPEILKIVALQMVQEAGVNLLLHTGVSDLVKEGNRIDSLIVQNKGGRGAIAGKVFVDATGDADLAAWSGAPYEVGAERLGGTLIFWLGNVDLDKAAKYQNLDAMGALLRKAIDNGDLPFGKDLFYSPTVSYAKDQPLGFGFAMCHVPADYPRRYTRQSEVRVWAAHIRNPDVLSYDGLTKAEVLARQKMAALELFFRKYVPGFENAYVVSSGSQIGIRETRRIIGDYKLTADDIRKGARFADVVARGVQEEFVKGYGVEPYFCPPHDVPYRALVPQVVENLLVSGRCISLTAEAAKLHSPRTQETCMIIGQAAGTAAALAVSSQCQPRDVDIKELQRRLVAQGANFGERQEGETGWAEESIPDMQTDVRTRPSALTLSTEERKA